MRFIKTHGRLRNYVARTRVPVFPGDRQTIQPRKNRRGNVAAAWKSEPRTDVSRTDLCVNTDRR